MKLLTAAQMRELDRAAIEDIGVPGIVLMENASRGVFDVIDGEFEELEGKRALVVCGKGNNGGDGFAVARHLLNAGAVPDVVLAAKPSDIEGDARINLDICRKMKIPVTSITDPRKLSPLRRRAAAADLVVDALLGTGVKGEVKPFYLKVINILNRVDCPVFSVDVPSGINVDEGRVYNGAVDADHTVTFGAAKVGLFMQPAASYAGNVYVVDIGIPGRLLDELKSDIVLTTRKFVLDLLRERPDNIHKGDCGKLLIVSGSRGMSGAPSLAGMAALRMGSGLVYLAVPKGIVNIVERRCTEGVTLPVEEDGRGRIAASAAKEIVQKVKETDAAVVGPGISVTDDTCELVESIVAESRKPVLVDADGLNCLARDPSVLKTARAPVIITPHPGEMGRLAGKKVAEVQAARLQTAREFAAKYGVIVVLKGANTVIASPGGRVFVNPTGNSGMATAGSGDVLGGIIGSLLAEGMAALEAAVCGVFIHGMAGDAASEIKGRRSVIASDMVDGISPSIRDLAAERD